MTRLAFFVAAVIAMVAPPGLATPFPLPCDSTVVRVILSPTSRDTLSFNVIDQEAVEVSLAAVVGSSFNPEYWIANASGVVVCGAFPSPTLIDCGPLPVAGNPYRIIVLDGGQDGL